VRRKVLFYAFNVAHISNTNKRYDDVATTKAKTIEMTVFKVTEK
jgi:hypothetical protein